ncbi:hypothetical protein [Streptomyces sp. PA5.6]|uniref:hypothetical protein n=1 Tax=Streptomyces sp. PA5.6 TaxID=3035651 RepID=UPI003904D951
MSRPYVEDSLDSAIAYAEQTLLSPDGLREQDEDQLVMCVKRVGRPEHVGDVSQDFAERLIHLAKLLGALGRKVLSLLVADLALRHMEVAEADQAACTAATWNELGSLLAEHEDLERARIVLSRALSRADQGGRAPERSRILANLSAVSLRMGDLRDAGLWAGKALAELDAGPGGDDPEARLTASWVRMEVARSGGSPERSARALQAFARTAEVFIASKGDDHPKAIAVRRALAAARYETAAASRDVERAERELTELEIVRLNATALLGAHHREAIVAQAALAVAEFEAASGEPGSEWRRRIAVSLLEDAQEQARKTLGAGREQTRAIREALAALRTTPTQWVEPSYLIDHAYTPEQNTERNDAKRKAIEAARGTVRLIAHGGVSYFLAAADLYYAPIIHALHRGVKFHAIISNPWNGLAVFMRPDETGRDEDFRDIVAMVEASSYYRETFVPVVSSYLELKERYGERVELRISAIDISGSVLLTSQKCFIEPYLTPNPEARTRRGLQLVELECLEDTSQYAKALADFGTQWELASSWKQFESREELHKQALRTMWPHWPTIT